MLKKLAPYIDLSPSQLDSLVSMPLKDLLSSPVFQQQIDSVDTSVLKQTLPTAGMALAEKLPVLYRWLKNEFQVARNPENPEQQTPWMCSFFNSRESLERLIETYRLEPLAPMEMERMAPDLVDLFDDVEDGYVRSEWQKAIALLCVLLIAAAREEAVSRGALV